MSEKWKMDDLHELLLEQLALAIEREELAESDLEDAFGETINAVLPKLEEAIEKDLSSREQEMLLERRSMQRGFADRNLDRWRAGFDKLERLIVMSEELGSAIARALGETASRENDPMYEAIISLHARAVLICREILCLMMNGFPDGALGRWRTLHEVAVAGQFISQQGASIAERFLAHRYWLSYERAKNYQRYAQRAGLEPLEDATMEHIKQTAVAVRHRYGDEIESDFGWASPALKIKRPKFIDLEAAVGLDHWRPRYKWATTNTHSTYRAPLEGLGMSEAIRPVRLVGPSNSGMTDPGHMTALSLNLATLPVVMLEPNLDRLAVLKIMLSLSNIIGSAFRDAQESSLAAARSEGKSGSP